MTYDDSWLNSFRRETERIREESKIMREETQKMREETQKMRELRTQNQALENTVIKDIIKNSIKPEYSKIVEEYFEKNKKSTLYENFYECMTDEQIDRMLQMHRYLIKCELNTLVAKFNGEKQEERLQEEFNDTKWEEFAKWLKMIRNS